MAALSCNINIEGYWRKANNQYIPNHNGIFFVYLASYNGADDTITPKKLIYIGSAVRIKEQVQNDLLTNNPWRHFESTDDELCFSAAYIPELDTERILSASIYYYKPPGNSQYVDYFTYDPTTIISTGKTALLDSYFMVQKKDK
jgi:hypothetical protein